MKERIFYESWLDVVDLPFPDLPSITNEVVESIKRQANKSKYS
jgi:hypothetical protein